MSWQKIAAADTDANSPLNQALMDKIRENLNALALESVLACMDSEAIVSIPSVTWVAVKQGKIWVPNHALSITAWIECYFYGAPSTRRARIRVEDGLGGYNVSSEGAVAGGAYGWTSVDVPATGSLAGAGAFRDFTIEMRHAEGTDVFARMRNVIMRSGLV